MRVEPSPPAHVALLYPGDRAVRQRSDPRESRFAALFDALAAAGISAEPAVYSDEFSDEVQAQLAGVRCVLVWHNPIEGGRPRTRLDAMLREVAARGSFISAHPDTIERMGTKDVLLAIREFPFGSDCWRIDSLAQLRAELPSRLERGARVLKQHRGHSGIGVWRLQRLGASRYAMRHAQRGVDEETVDLDGVLARLAPWFGQGGHFVDQAWQARLDEGMVRAYLVGARVAGFGHQAINALFPAREGEPAPAAGPRLYSAADDARFQDLRHRLESRWVAQLCEATGVAPDELPLLWDADFLLGERSSADAAERFVLCEINVSSVSPFPPSAIAPLVQAVAARSGFGMREHD